METINERIVRYRKFAGITQKEMADFLGIKLSTYSQKEKKGIIDCETLKKIAEVFEIDIMLLLYGENNYESEFIPVDKLTLQEKELVTMYRNASKNKQERILKFAYYTLKER